MSFTIQKLEFGDDAKINAVAQMFIESYDSSISRYLRYTDIHYINYLRASLAEAKNPIYVIVNNDTSELVGVAQYTLLDDTLLLNNIIVKNGFRGQNLALSLIKYAEQQVLKTKPLPNFALDVFEKNIAALAWYQRLGMAITATNYWYDLTHYYTNELPETTQTNKTGNELSIQPDEFGFSQVLSNNIRIATVLNGNTLITRALPRPDEMLNLRDFFGDKLNALCLITDRKLNFPIIDRSFRMVKEFKKNG